MNVHDFAALNRQEAAALLEHPETCGGCRPLAGVFSVGDEMHFGFYLSVDSGFDSLIWPIFGPGVDKTFYAAFSRDSLSASVDKKLYCECSGWVVAHNGIYFRIDKARIFAK